MLGIFWLLNYGLAKLLSHEHVFRVGISTADGHMRALDTLCRLLCCLAILFERLHLTMQWHCGGCMCQAGTGASDRPGCCADESG